MDLHRKYRPKKLEDVIGQPDAVAQIRGFIKHNRVPRTIMLQGPTGTGKTTIARILRKLVDCSDGDYVEINAASSRGIDTVREIEQTVSLAPLGGKARMWVIDECFHGNTLVDFYGGSVPIKLVQPGDLVYSLKGLARVKRTFVNRVELSRVVKITFDNGTVLFTTRQHEFLTSRGWVEVQNLSFQDTILNRIGYTMGGGPHVDQNLSNMQERFPDEEKQPGRLLSKLCMDVQERASVPDQLQGRYRKPGIESCCRGRRERPSLERSYFEGQEEEQEARRIRLESIESYELGRNDETFLGVISSTEKDQGFVEFYDLEIEGHPSYFVEGIPVHNCHKLTGEAQSAALKILEDAPEHAHFVLCTTLPDKLIDTVQGRCRKIKFSLVDLDSLLGLIDRVCEAERERIPKRVRRAVGESADGSPRRCLQLLGAALDVGGDEEAQLRAVQRGDVKHQSKDLATVLFKPKCTWEEIRKVLDLLDGDLESADSVRYRVLGLANWKLLNGIQQNRAAAVISAFEFNIRDGGMASLSLACYELFRSKEQVVPITVPERRK